MFHLTAARVFQLEDTTLPPLSQVLTPGTLYEKLTKGQCELLESHEQQQLERGDMVARALIKIGPKPPVRLKNLKNFPVTVKKGAVVGHCATVTSVVREI